MVDVSKETATAVTTATVPCIKSAISTVANARVFHLEFVAMTAPARFDVLCRRGFP